MKSETEGLIVAAQDQSLVTRSFKSRIIKDGTDPRCRLCEQFDETIEHITSGCPILAKTEYLKRHNNVATYIHHQILQHYNIECTAKWYEHEPKTVTTYEDKTILGDMPISTDREIKANKPDIVIKDLNKKKCWIIDISIPTDRNVALKEMEKLSKYKDLEIELNRMWKMDTIVVPIIVGDLGMLRKTGKKWLDTIPGVYSIGEVQKIALLGTAHILRKALSIKTV